MGNGMNKILPGVFLGNFRDARDRDELSANNITHILAIHDSPKPLLEDKIYLCIVISDNPLQDISQHIPACNDFIHLGRKSGGVLVHCLAGVSRSVAVVAAYIMTVSPLLYRDALNAIRGIRRCANPNLGFQRQLLQFQHESLSKEKARMREKFADDCWLRDDEVSMLRSSLQRFETFVQHGNSVTTYTLPPDAYVDRVNRTVSVPTVTEQERGSNK